MWTIDYKGQFRTGDGRWLYPLTVMDAHSRYLLACVGHGQVSGPAARTSLTAVFREYGLPERLRSDNGSPFASAGAGRISRLSAWWLRLGIGLERIDPGRPQRTIGGSRSGLTGFARNTTRSGRMRPWGNGLRRRSMLVRAGPTLLGCRFRSTRGTGSAAGSGAMAA